MIGDITTSVCLGHHDPFQLTRLCVLEDKIPAWFAADPTIQNERGKKADFFSAQDPSQHRFRYDGRPPSFTWLNVRAMRRMCVKVTLIFASRVHWQHDSSTDVSWCHHEKKVRYCNALATCQALVVLFIRQVWLLCYVNVYRASKA